MLLKGKFDLVGLLFEKTLHTIISAYTTSYGSEENSKIHRVFLETWVSRHQRRNYDEK